MGLSLGASLVMLTGKGVAYLLTHSAAIFSDAAESVIHLFATGVAAFALWYGALPADRDHPYGHGKIAYFSAGLEGAFILVAAGVAAIKSIADLIAGPRLQQLGLGLAITGGLALVNLALGLSLTTVGRRTDSLVLVANGKHVLTDMWTSIGTVTGVALVRWTGVVWFDPIAGLLVAGQIALTAIGLLRRGYRGLMDRAPDSTTESLVCCLQRAVRETSLCGFHQLRHRAVEDRLWVEVHLLVPGDMALRRAHALATELERSMQRSLPRYRMLVTSHIEPIELHGEHHPRGHAVPEAAEISPDEAQH